MSSMKGETKERSGALGRRNRSPFLRSLMTDLAAAGFRVRKSVGKFGGWRFSPPDQQTQAKRLRTLRDNQIFQSRDFIRRMESKGALALLGDGREIDPHL